MSKRVNETNLRRALVEIQRRVVGNLPMNFAVLCTKFNLGKTTAKKLKYALLEYPFKPSCLNKPSTWLYVKRDDKTWGFRFKSWDGTDFRKWNGLQSEIATILGAMNECPAEKANPTYYKEKSTNDVKIVEYISKDLSSFSDDELYAELQRREDERKAAEELARKKALIDKFLADTGLTINDLKDYE